MWSETTGLDLYLDKKARRVGDIVVVRIVEDPKASLNATTTTSKSSTIAAKLKLLGYMDALAAKNPRLAQVPGTDDLINATLKSDFSGPVPVVGMGISRPISLRWWFGCFPMEISLLMGKGRSK